MAIWEVVSVSGLVAAQTLPTVSSVASSLDANAGQLLSNVGVTLEAWAVGLAIAIVLGVVAGTAVGLSAAADAFTDGIVRMMRPMPSLALIPIAILIAGRAQDDGRPGRVLRLLARLHQHPPGGGAGGERPHRNGPQPRLAGDAPHRTRDLAGASPIIATGIQVAIGLAIVITISVEMVAASGGLGQFVLVAQQGGDTPAMYAGIVAGGALGWALNTIFSAVVQRALPWRHREGR